MGTTVWVDARAGVAGDMLAGALVDAGVPLEILATAVQHVVPDAVSLSVHEVQRNGLRATKLEVTALETEAPHRHLGDILRMVTQSPLDPVVGAQVCAVFEALAEAEAHVHGADREEIHFHEVGAADSIADIVSVCAALAWLDASAVFFSDVALGSGTVRSAHGSLSVPTPAALRLSRGLQVLALGEGELATPTGLALLTTLGQQRELPRLRMLASGTGAGTKDTPGRANVVRIVVGEMDRAGDALLMECNIDDMDPRLWPSAIEALLSAGADDAWLTPIVMKKGRPAHTLSVLCTRERIDALLDVLFVETSTIGARVVEVDKVALDRRFAQVLVDGMAIAVKLAGRNGRVYNVSVEFEDVRRVSAALERPLRAVLASAEQEAERAGYVVGAELGIE